GTRDPDRATSTPTPSTATSGPRAPGGSWRTTCTPSRPRSPRTRCPLPSSERACECPDPGPGWKHRRADRRHPPHGGNAMSEQTNAQTVADVMTPAPTTVDSTDTIESAARLMAQEDVGVLVVRSGPTATGVVT